MSNYSNVCPSCGAPLYGTGCPRCRYKRRPTGEVVFSGGAGGEVATAYTFLGSDQGTDMIAGGQLTIPGVTMNGVDTLYVDVVYDLSSANPPTVTWNGNSIPDVGIPTASINMEHRQFWLENCPAGSDSVVITFGIGTFAAVALAHGLAGASHIASEPSTDSGLSATSVSYTYPVNRIPTITVAKVATYGPVSDMAGSWGFTFTSRARVGTTGGVVSNITVALGVSIPTTTGTHDASYGTFTDREFIRSQENWIRP